MVGVMVVTVVFITPDPAAGTVNSCLCQKFLDTHRRVWLSLLWGHCSFLLGLGVHKVLLVPSKCVSPALWKFSNRIPLASKVKVPGGSQSFCQIPRLGTVCEVLELFNSVRISLV